MIGKVEDFLVTSSCKCRKPQGVPSCVEQLHREEHRQIGMDDDRDQKMGHQGNRWIGSMVYRSVTAQGIYE
jgi:hypothetical protein